MANNISIQQIRELVRDEVWTMLQEFLGMLPANHLKKYEEVGRCTSLKLKVQNLTEKCMSLEHEIQKLINEKKCLERENASFHLRDRNLPEIKEGASIHSSTNTNMPNLK